MKNLNHVLLVASFLAPTLATAVPASAITYSELQAAKRYCAGLGRNVGIRPDGTLGCGSALIAGSKEPESTNLKKGKKGKGEVSGIRFYYGAKAPGNSENTQ